MKTLEDLVTFVDQVVLPGFDVAAAERRLGAIESWAGELGRVESSDPTLQGTVIETLKGKLTGVQTRPTEPIEVIWRDLKRALGEPEKGALTVDDWGGPIPYRFNRPHGYALLYVKDGDGATARIHQIIVRPVTGA
jgi:hypothetical protein